MFCSKTTLPCLFKYTANTGVNADVGAVTRVGNT